MRRAIVFINAVINNENVEKHKNTKTQKHKNTKPSG